MSIWCGVAEAVVLAWSGDEKGAGLVVVGRRFSFVAEVVTWVCCLGAEVLGVSVEPAVVGSACLSIGIFVVVTSSRS